MELLSKTLDPSATSPNGLAYFLVTAYGAREVLRRPEIRALLLSKLNQEEATGLCDLLQLPAISPHQTLAGVNFNTPRNLELLSRWYGVESEEGEEPAQHPEGSQKAIATHKLRAHQLRAFRELRRAIASPLPTLVHMPFGAGKLRLVATAALDFFRSADDDKSVVWLAPGAAMCHEAFLELRNVWSQLGTRDITLFQLYGGYPARDLDRLGGSIAVIDILRIDKDDPSLQKLGASAAIVILADAQDLVHPVGAAIIKQMSADSPFPLVGILASPGSAIPEGAGRNDLKTAFSSYVTVAEEDGHPQPLSDIGSFTHISGSVVDLIGAQASAEFSADPLQAFHDNSLEVNPAYVAWLEKNVQRNENLLKILKQLSQAGGRIVLYATTPANARLFAGLLPVLGIPAASATSEESPEARTLAIQKFVAREESGVLCVHGFLLPGIVPVFTACVMASPIRSRASFLSTIGRLVQARDGNLPALRLMVAADSQADAALVNSLSAWSTLGSWPEMKT